MLQAPRYCFAQRPSQNRPHCREARQAARLLAGHAAQERGICCCGVHHSAARREARLLQHSNGHLCVARWPHTSDQHEVPVLSSKCNRPDAAGGIPDEGAGWQLACWKADPACAFSSVSTPTTWRASLDASKPAGGWGELPPRVLGIACCGAYTITCRHVVRVSSHCSGISSLRAHCRSHLFGFHVRIVFAVSHCCWFCAVQWWR